MNNNHTELLIRNISDEWGQTPLEIWIDKLGEDPERNTLVNSRKLISKIGLFGTAGQSTWRDDLSRIFQSLSTKSGVTFDRDQDLYDPVKQYDQRTADDESTESYHLINDAIILLGLEPEYKSIASMLEMGFGAAASLLKGKQMVVYLMDTNRELGESSYRARRLNVIDARWIEKMIPDNFNYCANLTEAARSTWKNRIRYFGRISSPITTESRGKILPREGIERKVCISRSSKIPNTPEQIEYLDFCHQQGLPTLDLLRPDWSEEVYEKDELAQKDSSLINTVMVTDGLSYGMIKDVGLSVFRSVANGTYSLIYFPQNPNNQNPDYIRARNLAKSHFSSLVKEFPWIGHYVRFVSSIEELKECTKAILLSK